MFSPRSDKPKITVKIRNMKRSSDRETPPPRKRSRSSLGRYDDSSDERMTPERVRRRSRGRSPSPRPRYPSESSHRDDYRSYPTYKVLCVSALHTKASDEVIKDTLYREYKKFGDLSVRISHDLDERVAYVMFRNSEDARDAKHAKPRIIVFDKLAIVEAVYESSRSSEGYRRRSVTPDYDSAGRYYHQRSRSPAERHRPSERAYDRAYGPPPALTHRDFRPPPHHHSDFLRAPLHHPAHLAPPGPPHHYGPPRHMLPPGGGAFKPHPPFDKYQDNKKDKFPNYLHHVPPEDDPLATRTLFAGNLEINISEEELRRIFGRYGHIEDIDVKRPLPNTGNAYAFIRFQNLDQAHRAKVELSGQYIGKFQCKIGYGKASPTTRIWIGGLGPWTSISALEREFDRFGAIKKIEYAKGDSCAYIHYDSIDAATAAVKEMRGFPLGGPDRRLRADFADVSPPGAPQTVFSGNFKARAPASSYDGDAYDAAYDSTWGFENTTEFLGYGRGFRGRGGGWHHERRGRGAYRGGVGAGTANYDSYSRDEEWRPRDADLSSVGTAPGGIVSPRSPRRPRRTASVDSNSSAGSETRRNGGTAPNSNSASSPSSSVRTLVDLARRCSAIASPWQGALILKNSLFPAKCHLADGESEIVETLMKDEDNKNLLRITQRLRLDLPKLEDVSKRIDSSSAHAILLGLPGSSASFSGEDTNVQTRPLRNLVSYLKQKEAAGVISLLNKETESTGVLYAFPPCEFSTNLLKRTAPNLSEESMKEDHLVIVVVKGGSA